MSEYRIQSGGNSLTRREGELQRPRTLPAWLTTLASVAIAFHLFALAIVALAARSGPWLSDFGPSPMEPPQFAAIINGFTARYYLLPLHMDHNYHFQSNRTNMPSVYFEAKALDEQGKVVSTFKFPDDKANWLVRQRQKVLAQNLGDDQPVGPARRNVIPAPGQERPKTIFFFNPGGPAAMGKPLDLYEADEPPPAPIEVFRPSDWSLVLVKSYARHLRRQQGAAEVEIVRHSRPPVLPLYLFVPNVPPGTFEDLVCNFGNGDPKLLQQ